MMNSDDFHNNASTAELAAWQRGWNDCREADRQQRGGDVVAFRVLRKNHDGEWVSDGRSWCDGQPSDDLIADIAQRSDTWRIEYARAALAVQSAASDAEIDIAWRAYQFGRNRTDSNAKEAFANALRGYAAMLQPAASAEQLDAAHARGYRDGVKAEKEQSAALAAQPAASAEPSEQDLLILFGMWGWQTADGREFRFEHFKEMARHLVGRYGAPVAAQAPAAAGDAQPVAWVAADTLNSPHPTCISSLAYMSQLDRERGREYTPLYTTDRRASSAATNKPSRNSLNWPSDFPMKHEGDSK